MTFHSDPTLVCAALELMLDLLGILDVQKSLEYYHRVEEVARKVTQGLVMNRGGNLVLTQVV